MSKFDDAAADDQDWFSMDEEQLVQELQNKANVNQSIKPAVSEAAVEFISGGSTATEEYLKHKRLQAAAATSSNASPQRLGTSDLRKISQFEPLDMFLCAMTYEPSFFIDQLSPNDAQDRVLLYAKILLDICDLELPGFQMELIQHFTTNEGLWEHFHIIATKLLSKRYKAMWKDEKRIDEVLHIIQGLLLHAECMQLLTPKMVETMRAIRTLIEKSDAKAVLERQTFQVFSAQLDRILNEIKEYGDDDEQSSGAENVKIYPSLEELINPIAGENSLKENLNSPSSTDHKYANVAAYINRQKLLLRIDFIAPLKECVQVLRDTGSFKSYPQPMVLYEDVYIVFNTNFVKAHRHELLFVDLLGSRRDNKPKNSNKRYLQGMNKTIKSGSLLVFTSSREFENLLLATVTYTDREMIGSGYIGIEIIYQKNIANIYNKQLLMFETPAFFEPYNNVYNYLSNCDLSSMPLQRYIIEGEKNVQPPPYLTEKSQYTYESETFKPLSPPTASPKKLPVNMSQLAAYRNALSQELCLIQGPPGTGKTHLSVHLVLTLMANAKTPIVLITYTNESLDKFLLKLAPYTFNIWRFGSQTRQPEIARFNVRSDDTDKGTVNPRLKRLHFVVKEQLIERFKALQELINEFDGTEEAYQEILKGQHRMRDIIEKSNCIRVLFQYYTAREKGIIAMTTTCAAKLNCLFRLLKSQIVIFEEAAEILEPHILACLTPYTQHVVMIGDHMQLQPYTSSYSHGRESQLNISLFERLVRQELVLSVLNIQYRMRPCIADLICPAIYAVLKNADIVETYPLVRRMHKNVYFWAHEEPESKSKHECSIFNQFEIENVLLLARYLITFGQYNADDVVILSPYAKQIELIRDQLKNDTTVSNVQAATVDSFQGLEANIVILSLVRSNAKGQIGFLQEKNRVCVALSRAKYGLYMMGNLKLLAQKSAVWREVKQKLETQEAIGSEFPYE